MGGGGGGGGSGAGRWEVSNPWEGWDERVGLKNGRAGSLTLPYLLAGRFIVAFEKERRKGRVKVPRLSVAPLDELKQRSGRKICVTSFNR